jgi:hypothetical protein
MGIQERDQFLHERLFSMMLLVARDVAIEPLLLRLAYREGGIAFLPFEGSQFRKLAVNPAGRIPLDGADDRGERFVLR